MNSKVANKHQINKELFKLLNNVAKHKKLAAVEPVAEAAAAAAVEVEAAEPVAEVEAAAAEPMAAVEAAEPVAAVAAAEPAVKMANKNMNISKMCKAFSSKKKQ